MVHPAWYGMLDLALFADDLLHESNIIQETHELFSTAVNVFVNSGMKLRKFNTSSEKIKSL